MKSPKLVAAGMFSILALGVCQGLSAQQPARPDRPTAPTRADVKYGPHERNVMDVWLAKSDDPTPVLFSIHGGGFKGGNKSVDRRVLRACLDSGISVVAITYRLSQDAIAPASFTDSARAVQFVRHKAKEWNLDPARFASTGTSAGAGISMWLAFHDDMADPKNADPVLRESTRLTCAVVLNGQSSYDPRFIKELMPTAAAYKHEALAQLFGTDISDPAAIPADKIKLIEEVSALPHLTKDDAPVLLGYEFAKDAPTSDLNVAIHHPKFGYALQERMDQLGIDCEVHTDVRRGTGDWAELTLGFVEKHFALPRKGKRETSELFNGKDLSGWIGHKHLWSVENGEIVGRSTEPVPVSTYLLTERNFSDFRLVFEFQLAQSEMHSGIAFWGRVAPEKNDPHTYAGHLVMFPSNYGYYDLYGRNSIHRNAERAKPVGKQHDWNTIEILAQGNRIRFVLNGELISDWREPQPERIQEAPIGLQLHSNTVPQEVRFRNLKLETFPEDRLTTVKQGAKS
ncbi:MAG: family 16 glycoside hydrolase [Planctomycetales bacterium]